MLKAYRELDGTTFQGRLLHILPARDKLEKSEPEVSKSKKTRFQKEKDAKLKENQNRDEGFIFDLYFSLSFDFHKLMF